MTVTFWSFYLADLDCDGGYWAICPEIPGANGQGETVTEAKNNLREAIELLLEDRKADMLRGLSEDAIQEKLLIA